MVRRVFLRVCRRLWSSLPTERVLRTLEERGLLNQCTKYVQKVLKSGNQALVGKELVVFHWG